MATLLEQLQAKGLSLDDARNAMSMTPGSNFNYLGENVPTVEDLHIPSAPPLAAPAAPIPDAIPNTLRPSAPESYPTPVEDVAPEADYVDRQNAALSKLKSKPAHSEHKQPNYAERQKTAFSKLQNIPDQPTTEDREKVALEKLQGMPDQPTERKLGRETEATRENLLAAQQTAKDSAFASLIGKAGAQLGGAIGHQSKDVVDRNMALADEAGKLGQIDQKQLMERIALEKEDPNSRYSMAAKNFLKEKFNVDIPEGISAEALDKTFMGPALKAFEAEQNRIAKTDTLATQIQDRQERAKQHEDNMKVYHDQLAQQNAQHRQDAAQRSADSLALRQAGQQTQQDRVYGNQLNTLRTKVLTPSSPDDRQNRTRMLAADNMFLTALPSKVASTIKTEQDIDRIDPSILNAVNRPQVVELGMEGARALTGGNPAQATINKLVPNNMNMTSAQVMDFITSKLNPADQAEVVKSYLKLGFRLRENSKKHEIGRLKKVLAGTDKIRMHNTEDYDDMVDTLAAESNIDRNELVGKGSKSPSLSDRSEDLEAIKWAKDNPTDPRAQQILQMHGVSQ